MKELADTISQEEQAYLEQIVSENIEAEILRRQLTNKLTAEEVKTAQEDLKSRLSLDIVKKTIRNRRKATALKISATVFAFLFIAFGIYWMKSERSNNNPEMLASKLYGDGVQLTLSNGKTVNLSGEQAKVQMGDITINNSNKTLTYSSANAISDRWGTLNIPIGKDYKIRLADGTEIQLNSQSSLSFPLAFRNSVREITIKGEAYLKVASNPSQPFIVHLPGSTVKVLGTEFNVNTYDSTQVRVSLVEGSVRFKTQRDSLQLKPGFEAAVNSRQSGIQLSPFDEGEVLSWRTGIQEFTSVPLLKVFTVISRWYGKQVVTDNPEIGSRSFTGILDRTKSIEDFLDGLKFTHELDYTIQGDKIYISNNQ